LSTSPHFDVACLHVSACKFVALPFLESATSPGAVSCYFRFTKLPPFLSRSIELLCTYVSSIIGLRFLPHFPSLLEAIYMACFFPFHTPPPIVPPDYLRSVEMHQEYSVPFSSPVLVLVYNRFHELLILFLFLFFSPYLLCRGTPWILSQPPFLSSLFKVVDASTETPLSCVTTFPSDI